MLGVERAASASRPDRRLRLPRSARLRRRYEFQRVYESGVRAAGRFMVVFVRNRRKEEPTGRRLGVTASRRVGNAVRRARCRRRLRELFRTDIVSFADTNVDVVINARRGCADAPWRELQRDYRQCMERLMVRLGPGP